MNRGVMVGMHHIFFQPRLDLPFFEIVEDTDVRDAFHLLVLNHSRLKEFERPVITTVRCVTRGKGDEVRLAGVI